ncbi:MAG: pilus assembly PilX N-terminal domain-containing protein [Pseudomonadota bacterium]
MSRKIESPRTKVRGIFHERKMSIIGVRSLTPQQAAGNALAIYVQGEKGIALVTVILMLAVLLVLGVIAVNLTNVGTKITSNTKTSKQAFYLAEAGIERARELLRTRLVGGGTLSQELNSVKGANGILTDSTNVSNFSTTDDSPYVNSTSLGSGSYRVYLTNDAVDGVTSITDNNGIVTLTSFGYGPDNSQAIVQATVQKGGGIPPLPGAITMPGPHVSFDGGSSNASTYSGDATHPAIVVNSADARTDVINGIPINRRDNYTGGGLSSPSVVNMVIPDPWGNLSQLQDLYTNLKSMADFSSPSNPGFTLGTTAFPKIVVIDDNYTVSGGTTGAGILLVTGNLTLNGNISYDGMVLVVGKGNLIRGGGGNGTITGGIFVADIAGEDRNINTTGDNTWRNPSWITSGGGTSDIDYVTASESNALNIIPFKKLTWKQIGL